MTDTERLLATVPLDSDRCVVIFPAEDGQTAIRWHGITAKQLAEILYQCADGVVEQRVPLKGAT